MKTIAKLSNVITKDLRIFLTQLRQLQWLRQLRRRFSGKKPNYAITVITQLQKPRNHPLVLPLVQYEVIFLSIIHFLTKYSFFLKGFGRLVYNTPFACIRCSPSDASKRGQGNRAHLWRRNIPLCAESITGKYFTNIFSSELAQHYFP